MQTSAMAFACLLTISTPCLAITQLQPGEGIFAPYSHHDEPSISVALGVVLTLGQGSNPFAGSTAAFSSTVGYIPYSRQDKWDVALPLTAELGLFDWYAARGIVKPSRTPVTLRAELNVQPGEDNPANLRFVKPELGTGVELRFPWQGTPELELYSELRLGVDLDWYRLKFPALTYSWDTESGHQFRTLGVSLDMFAPGGSCTESSPGVANCPFETGLFRLNGGIPEPATWSMLLFGFGLLGTCLRARSANLRPHQMSPSRI